MNQPVRALSRFGPCLLTVLLLAAGAAPLSAQEEEHGVRHAARLLAEAILTGESARATTVLPHRGRVRVDLPQLAPAAGGSSVREPERKTSLACPPTEDR